MKANNNKKFVAYIRVSTKKQGNSGLGLEAQKKMCKDFISRNNGECVAMFQDVESGTHRERKGLWQAIDFCKKNGCPLVIAKLDRLARDVEFTFRVMNTGIEIHFTDMPVVNTMVLGVFAAVAQYELEQTRTRTQKALEQKKLQGAKLGAQNEKWQKARDAKTQEQLDNENKKRGDSKSRHFMESRDVQCILRIIRNVFPSATTDQNPSAWNWNDINTNYDNRLRIKSLMQDYKEMDEQHLLFAKWELDEMTERQFQVKLAAMFLSIKRSIGIK